jgi:hypothetical protein
MAEQSRKRDIVGKLNITPQNARQKKRKIYGSESVWLAAVT